MYRRLFIVFIVLIFTGMMPDAFQAQQTASPPILQYTGLNLMLIIDQSGSMGGPDYGGPAIWGDGNDPYGLRFAGPQYVVKWLTGFHETVIAVEKPDLNLSVIYFGTSPRQVLDWTRIDSDNPSQLALLDDDLSATRNGPRNLGDTDFGRAFDSASDLFERRPTPKGGGDYLDVIVVLTDGGPCTSADSGFSFTDSDGTTRYNCQVNSPGAVDVLGTMTRRLETLANFVSDQMSPNNYEFHIIALDANGDFWPVLEEQNSLWTNVICPGTTCDERLQRVINPGEIGGLLQSLLGDISQQIAPGVINQTQVALPGGTFTVPPYQQLARISVFKQDDTPLSNIAFMGPSGVASPDGATTTTPIDVFNLNNPQPGGWQVTGIEPTQVVSMTADFIAYGMEAAGISAEQEMLSSVPLDISLVDGDGNVATYLIDYPLTVNAMIYDATLVDRANRPLLATIPLTQNANNPTTARFTGAWLPRTPGRYEIRVTATYPGAAVPLVNDQTIADNLTVAGSTVEWSGIQPTSQREDMRFTVLGTIRNNLTGDIISNTTELVTRITLTDPTTGTEVYSEILPNEGVSPGELMSTFGYAQPGTYLAVMQAGIFDQNNVFEAVGNPSNPQTLTIRPLRTLRFNIVSPQETSMDAQRIRITPRFEFNLNVPVTLRIQLTDNAGNLVSLAGITAGLETKPGVTLNPGVNARDLTADLVETSPGVYAVELDNLGMGEYEFAISSSIGNDQLLGDYIWGSQTGTFTLTRNLSYSLVYLLIGAVAVMVVGGGTGAFLIERRRRMHIAPLNGSIGFISESNNQRQTIGGFSFENEKRNRRRLTKGDLPFPFEQLVISTDGDERGAERGQVYIRKIQVDDSVQLTRRAAEGEIRLHGEEGESVVAEAHDGTLYFIVRNPGFGGVVTDIFDGLRN